YSVANLGSILTTGGSPTWQREGANILNFAVVQALAYRPVDNVMVAGTHGNGMYYTSLGTPNFTGVNTAIPPVTNNPDFIIRVSPSVTRGRVYFQTGNLFSIKKMVIQLFNTSGQLLMRSETGYQDGSVDLGRFSQGNYFLTIQSSDGHYREVQKLVRL
ncbi:MAG: T9SS type A sorting domain-containing protein, partial [Flavisolibacter sp.]